MSEKKFMVRAECPACGCGLDDRLTPELLRDKFVGNEAEIDVLCPRCAKTHKVKVTKKEEE